MTRKLSLLIIAISFCLGLFSQTITGNFSLLSGQKINLEGFNGLKTYPISSSKIDDNKNYNIETLDENKEVLPLSQFMIQVLSSVNQMERVQIRQRIKSGYDNYRKIGGKVGRKKGFKKSEDNLLEEHRDIIKYIRQGQSIRNTMKLTGKSSGTVQKIKRLMT